MRHKYGKAFQFKRSLGNMVRISYDELRSTFEPILAKRSMAPGAARACATLLADATRDFHKDLP